MPSLLSPCPESCAAPVVLGLVLESVQRVRSGRPRGHTPVPGTDPVCVLVGLGTVARDPGRAARHFRPSLCRVRLCRAAQPDFSSVNRVHFQSLLVCDPWLGVLVGKEEQRIFLEAVVAGSWVIFFSWGVEGRSCHPRWRSGVALGVALTRFSRQARGTRWEAGMEPRLLWCYCVQGIRLPLCYIYFRPALVILTFDGRTLFGCEPCVLRSPSKVLIHSQDPELTFLPGQRWPLVAGGASVCLAFRATSRVAVSGPFGSILLVSPTSAP